MNLFDPAPYTKGTPRSPRTRKQAPEPDRCRLGQGGWALISVGRNPEAHILLGGQEADRVRREMRTASYGASITLCRRAGTPLTYDDGTLAGACPRCVAAGAHIAVA